MARKSNISQPRTVGAYEAKTHLPSLLKEVERGREVIITKRHQPIAKLSPIKLNWPDEDFFKRLEAFRQKVKKLPRGETVKDLINAGRRI